MMIHEEPVAVTAAKIESELINAQTLADMLSVSIQSVRRLTDSGRVPGVVRLGRSVRYRRSVVLKWLDTNCIVMVSPNTKRGSR